MVVASNAQDAAEVIRAVAALLWPLMVGFVILSLRGEIPGLARRLRRLGWPGGGADFDAEVRELEEQADAGEAQVEQQLRPSSQRPPVGLSEQVLRLAEREPALAILALSEEVERLTRDLASISGYETPYRGPWQPVLQWLVDRGIVPRGIASSGGLLASVRNRVAHAKDLDTQELTATIDAGLRLLRVLEAIPTEGYEVAFRPLLVYRDEAATTAYDDVRGVVLWDFDAQGNKREYHIYPTRRAYEPGQRVGWQWSFDGTWDEAWWRDPLDGDTIKLAWSQSAEFVGERLLTQPEDEPEP